MKNKNNKYLKQKDEDQPQQEEEQEEITINDDNNNNSYDEDEIEIIDLNKQDNKIKNKNLKAKEHASLSSASLGNSSDINKTTTTTTTTTTSNSITANSSLNTSSGINSSNENTPIIGVLKVDTEILINSSRKKELPLFNLICLTISFLGVQFGWALQIAFSTPLFLELGVSQKWVSYIWLAGPISGLIVQPLVGVLTDRSESRFGRRKPFILIGSIFISVGLLLISNAESIGLFLGDTLEKKSIAISIAIIGFWVLDLSNNAVQAPCRALLVDVATPSQQSLGSSLFSLMLGTGNLLGYMMGSIDLIKMVPFMKTDTRALFTLSIMVLTFCIILTLGFVTEEQYTRVNEGQSTENPLKTMFKGIIGMPLYLQRLCVVQFFSWIGWFSFILFITTWVGVNVFGGDPNAPEYSDERILFQDGVRWGSLGLTISSGITIVISLLIPFLVRYIHMKYIYLGGNLLQCIFFGLFYFIHDKIGAICLIAATGIPWAIVMILPFSIVGLGIQNNESSGLNIGTLNIFVVVPQMVVSVGISFVIESFHNNVVYSLLTGSIASLFATLFTFRIIIPHHDRLEDIDEIQYNNNNINISSNGNGNGNGKNKYSPINQINNDDKEGINQNDHDDYNGDDETNNQLQIPIKINDSDNEISPV